MSEVTICDQPGSHQYVIEVEGAKAGFLTYKLAPEKISFMHAEVEPSMESRGLGSRLVAFALDDARRRGLAVLPFCPFVASYIHDHREYLELVPEAGRARFGL
jgi:predicted GNAT family acetyltransferase